MYTQCWVILCHVFGFIYFHHSSNSFIIQIPNGTQIPSQVPVLRTVCVHLYQKQAVCFSVSIYVQDPFLVSFFEPKLQSFVFVLRKNKPSSIVRGGVRMRGIAVARGGGRRRRKPMHPSTRALPHVAFAGCFFAHSRNCHRTGLGGLRCFGHV